MGAGDGDHSETWFAQLGVPGVLSSFMLCQDHGHVKEAQAPEKVPPDHCLHPPKDSTHLVPPRCSHVDVSHTKDAPGFQETLAEKHLLFQGSVT